MLNPTTATTTRTTTRDDAPARALTAFAEDTGPAGLFTEPVDVSQLEDLEVDELGRRSRWLPADVLL